MGAVITLGSQAGLNFTDVKKTYSKRPTGMIQSSSKINISLHSDYLAFAIKAAALKPRASRPLSGLSVSRNVVEAIRYSYDFIEASGEYLYWLTKSGPDGDPRADTWLRRYIDRGWNGFTISDKLGLLSTTFLDSPQGFWTSEPERGLFEDLKHVRNALTHPGLFGKSTEAAFPDFHAEAVWSQTTVSGKMKREGKSHARFAEHPEDLGAEDARKAVEIALRHSARFEELLGAKNAVMFGVPSTRTGEKRAASRILARMKKRHFDAVWGKQ